MYKVLSCKRVIKAIALLIMVSVTAFVISFGANEVLTGAKEKGQLAIIIDDFGSSREGVLEMMAIEEHLTFAIMPFMERTKQDMASAKAKSHEIIVHLAMEPISGKRSWLGPSPIMCGMSPDEIRSIVEKAVEDIPFAIGANIHMGSRASCEEVIMEAVLSVMKEKEMYFVDSRTGKKPVAKSIAEEIGVRCLENNIFLDGQKSKEHIKKQLEKAAKKAKSKGSCIAIGHVGIEGGVPMARAIVESKEMFEEMGVELVYVSELIQKQELLQKDKYINKYK